MFAYAAMSTHFKPISISLLLLWIGLLSSCQHSVKHWRTKADKAYAAANYQEAASAYQQVLKLDSTQTEARFFWAVCEQMQQQYLPAIQNLNKVLKQDPEAYKAALNRGHCHYALRDYPSAMADYELVLSIKPGYGLALNPLAHMQFYLGDTVNACQTLDEAIDAVAGREVDPALLKACENR